MAANKPTVDEAPEKIWIDSESDSRRWHSSTFHWPAGVDDKPVEYIRADLATPVLVDDKRMLEVLCPKCHKHFPNQLSFTTVGLWTIGWTCPDCHTTFNLSVNYHDLSQPSLHL